MEYKIYTLKFLTPVHFGESGSLEKTSFICSADIYFSALCQEAALISNETVKKLIEKFSTGKLQLSSLFPYYMNDGDLELYLPKPLWQAELVKKDIQPFSVMKEQMTQLKKMKKSSFIRVSQLQELVTSLNKQEFYNVDEPIFAYKEINAKVNSRLEEPMPYFVNTYHFTKNAGLYFIVGFENENDLSELEELIKSLGYTGIGGKRSSGYGKYEIAEDAEPFILDKDFPLYNDDDMILARMLDNKTGKIQLAVAPLAPLAEDVAIIKMGVYKLLKRSGFVYAAEKDNFVKKNNIYMLAEGSCFGRRIQGKMIEEQIDGVSHKIYRNGMGMFVGLNYE